LEKGSRYFTGFIEKKKGLGEKTPWGKRKRGGIGQKEGKKNYIAKRGDYNFVWGKGGETLEGGEKKNYWPQMKEGVLKVVRMTLSKNRRVLGKVLFT